MNFQCWSVLLVILPAVSALWRSSQEEKRIGFRRAPLHSHSKRHMIPSAGVEEQKLKRRVVREKHKDVRKKPSGHLKPLDEDDMENDEVVSVAVGPPPIRPKYEKGNWRHTPKQHNHTNNSTATELVKDVLMQLGREFLTHQVSEDFVFGQYVGNTMKNLTGELRLQMQHDILELVVKYQNLNRGGRDAPNERKAETTEKMMLPVFAETRNEKRAVNETDENWPDFSNLAKIVG